MKIHKPLLLAVISVGLVAGVSACAASCAEQDPMEPSAPVVVELEDCDAEDLRNREDECKHLLKPSPVRTTVKPMQSARQPAPVKTTRKR